MPAAFAMKYDRRSSHLGRCAAALAAADRLREHMARFGTTLAGQVLWTRAESKLLRRCYPDYQRACAALPRRSRCAIGGKAVRLGITQPRRIWSDSDLKCLKTLYRTGTPVAEIMRVFPGKTAKQIWHRAAYSGWYRPPKPPKTRNLAPYDSVRTRAFELKCSMRDLAYLSRTGSYFLGRPARINWKKISKAVALLDGQLTVVWRPHEGTSSQALQQQKTMVGP